jgi:hypothetical protein
MASGLVHLAVADDDDAEELEVLSLVNYLALKGQAWR